MQKHITVAIVTKNRPKQLERCLKSLIVQTLLPEVVLVIDDDPNKSAYSVIAQFKNIIPIAYLHKPNEGVQKGRNTALIRCQTPFLSFIDDDCVADKNWLHSLYTTITQKKAAYCIGESKVLNPQYIISETQYIFQNYWFKKQINCKQEITSYYFDTKNCMIQMKNFKKHHLIFDIRYKTYPYGDISDTDLGYALYKQNTHGIYTPWAIIYHEETPSLYYLIKKAYQKGANAYLFEKKWDCFGTMVNIYNKGKIRWTLRTIKYWKNDYAMTRGSSLHRLCQFFIYKIYERSYIEGYVHMQQKNNPTKILSI